MLKQHTKRQLKTKLRDKLQISLVLCANYNTKHGKRVTRDVLQAQQHIYAYAVRLMDVVERGVYCPSPYHTFWISDPKRRLILAPYYGDRILQQWLVENFLAPYYYPRFIYTNCACIPGRGTHFAVAMAQHYMRAMQRRYGEYYILKMDISKFFSSIDRDILFWILQRDVSDPELLQLFHTIIFSAPEQPGIPLGSCTSQNFANIYLNELDQYCKNELHAKYYVRYMDDFVLFAPDRATAKYWFDEIDRFVNVDLHLKLNPKSCYFPSSKGLDFVGYVIRHGGKYLRRRAKQKIDVIIWRFYRGYTTPEEFARQVSSWYGHACHSDNIKLIIKKLMPYREVLLAYWKQPHMRTLLGEENSTKAPDKSTGL